MSEKYKKIACGIEPSAQIFKLSENKSELELDFTYCFSDSGRIYCSVLNDGFKVYDEKSLKEVFSGLKIIDMVCSLGSSVILLGEDKLAYRYRCDSNSVEKISVESSGTCLNRNQNGSSNFLLMLGTDPNNDSFWDMEYYIYKYRKEPFELEWKVPMVEDEVYQFLIDESSGKFYSISSGARIYCQRLDTGEVVWEKDISHYSNSESKILNVHPALVNNSIVLVYQDSVIAISTDSGDLVWKNKEGCGGVGIVSNDYKLYQLGFVGDDRNRSLITTDVNTGDIISKHHLTAESYEMLDKIRVRMANHWVISTTHVIVGWGNGYVTAINPENGHIDWYVDLGNGKADAIMPGMMISNNRLYCRTARSDVNDRVMKSYVFEGEGGFGAV